MGVHPAWRYGNASTQDSLYATYVLVETRSETRH